MKLFIKTPDPVPIRPEYRVKNLDMEVVQLQNKYKTKDELRRFYASPCGSPSNASSPTSTPRNTPRTPRQILPSIYAHKKVFLF